MILQIVPKRAIPGCRYEVPSIVVQVLDYVHTTFTVQKQIKDY